MKTFAQNKRVLKLTLWACGFSCALNQTACNRQPADLTGQSLIADQVMHVSLRGLASGCLGETPTTIYAHYIEQTMNDAVCMEDIIGNQSGQMSCSPGPFLTEGIGAQSTNEKWSMTKTPDYFVWHISSDSTDQNIYLTNQNGYPIKSQVIHLKNNDEATLVLLPKSVLDEGSTYYMYLTLTQNNQRQTWVQPLAISRNVAAK